VVLAGREFGDALRIFLRQYPGHGRAPIVPNYGCLMRAEELDEVDYISNQDFNAVVSHSRRFIAQVVASHVRSDDMILFF
jgi:hypothetical protein